jgi:hypothetical protein
MSSAGAGRAPWRPSSDCLDSRGSSSGRKRGETAVALEIVALHEGITCETHCQGNCYHCQARLHQIDDINDLILV